MGESFKKMLWINKRYVSVLETILEMLVFIAPLFVPLLIQREWFFREAGKWADIIAFILSGIFIAFVAFSLLMKLRGKNDKHENYMPIVNEQIECICEDKYRALCREIDNGHRYENGEVLLYDAHDSIRTILIYIKQLVSAVTGVGLSNLSVTFVYKYMGENEEWQEIDGSSATTMGKLNTLVEYSNSKTLYHYMINNNVDYRYIRDKSKAIGFEYMPSTRDGDNLKSYGSIMCRRYKCMLHGEAAVDAMLSISSYGEKFSVIIGQNYIEQLLRQNIARYEWLIKTEMASLYLRHRLRAEFQKSKMEYVIALLKIHGWIDGKNATDFDEVSKAIRNFKKYVSKQKGDYPNRWVTIDSKLDDALIANLESGIYRK